MIPQKQEKQGQRSFKTVLAQALSTAIALVLVDSYCQTLQTNCHFPAVGYEALVCPLLIDLEFTIPDKPVASFLTFPARELFW